jgi:hypothetical protein
MSGRRAFCLVLLWLSSVNAGLWSAEVEISCTPLRVTARQGEKIDLEFIVRNRSAYKLDQVDRFFISYHVRDLAGRMLRFENRRFILPEAIRPSITTRFVIPVYFSLDPGTYRLEWDLVREGEFWGGDKGWQAGTVDMHLLPLVSPGFKKDWLPTFYESGLPQQRNPLQGKVLRLRRRQRLPASVDPRHGHHAWLCPVLLPALRSAGDHRPIFHCARPTRGSPGLGGHHRPL